MTTIRVHAAGVADLLRSIAAQKAAETVAKDVAEEMAIKAGSRAPDLADAIQVRSGTDENGAHAEIGVDSSHFFYWIFVNSGTERQPALNFVESSLHYRSTSP